MVAPTVTPTNNAVGSKAGIDLIYNAQTLDIVVNADQPTTPDRFGNPIDTLSGISNRANSAIDSIGWIFLTPSTFDTGVTITLRNQALLWAVEDGGNGWHYKWNGPLNKIVPAGSTPLTTGGIGEGAWEAVQSALSYVQDERPSSENPVGARWFPTGNIQTAKTSLLANLNGNAHWLQEFVQAGSGDAVNEPLMIGQFDPNAGSGGDDTEAFLAMEQASFDTGRGVVLDRQIRIRSRTEEEGNYRFKRYFVGLEGSKITAFDSPERYPDGGGGWLWKRLLPMEVSDITVCGFEIDGNISDDPVDEAGWAAGYNSFTGSRGLVFYNSRRYRVYQVKTRNTMWAGIAHYNCIQYEAFSNDIKRCRGNFGDGMYNWGRNFDCFLNEIEDVTRIGIVAETNAGSTYTTRNGKIFGNKVKYGHDASGLYGGVEGNVGIWLENTLNVNTELNEVDDFLEGGIRSVPAYVASAQPSVADVRYATTVHTNNMISGVRYGYLIDCIYEDMQNRTHIIGGSVINANVLVYMGTQALFVPKNYVYIKGLDGRLSVHNSATRALMQLAGYCEWDGGNIIFDDGFDQAAWDSSSEVNGYSTFGAFGTDSGYECKIKNVNCYKEIAGVLTEIGVRTKFQNINTRSRLSLVIENCITSQISNFCKSFHYKGGEARKLGSDVPTDKLLYERVKITGRQLLPADNQVVGSEATTVDILLDHCHITMNSADEYLYLYKLGGTKVMPYARAHGCIFERNMELYGSPIRANADPDLLADYDNIFNIGLSQCQFINTGGTTSAGIVDSDYDLTDGAKVLGVGNYKTANITNNVTGDIDATNFSVMAL